MWRQLLLLSCCFTIFTMGHGSSISYLLLVPAEVHFPSNETFCVDVRGAQEPLRVTVTLQYGIEDKILFQEMVTESQLFQCIQFQTPPPEVGAEEVMTVHISLVGPSTQMSDSKNILLRSVSSAALIQTDKPIYKRGETVNFRILNFNRDFLAVEDIGPMVELQDPNKNRIGQWLNLKPQKGILDMSYSLDSEAQPGAYTIISSNARQDFHVAENVQPTFEVNVKLPSVVTILEKSISLLISAQYTYGEAVHGEMTAKVCRKAVGYYWMSMFDQADICKEYKGQTDKNGRLEMEVPTEPFHLRLYDYQMNFDVQASLVENGTGTERNATGSSRITAKIASVTFDDTGVSDSYYKTGLKYKTKMTLKSADGSPMKSKKLYLTEKYDKTVKERVYETNEDGEVYLTLNTRPWKGNTVYLTASYQKNKPQRKYGELNAYSADAHRTLQPFTTITQSFLKVQPLDHPLSCDKMQEIEIDYIIRSSEVLSEEDTLEIHYTVMAKGNLELNGKIQIPHDKNSVMMGTAILPLNVTAEISPLASIFAYTILGNGKIAADTERFPVEKCFKNKVTMGFLKEEASPGSAVTLHVNADPGSLCSVRAVDEGVLFMRPEAEISRDRVYSFVSRRNQYGYPYRVAEEDPICWRPRYLYNPFGRGKRSDDWQAPSSTDVFTLLKQLGLKVITNTQVKKPTECMEYPQVAALSSYGDYGNPTYVAETFESPSTIPVDDYDDSLLHDTLTMAELTNKIQTLFPETWMWELVTVGSSGQTALSMQLPDTVTEWKTTAFCMGDTGMGIAPTTSIRAFKPFFADMTLPHSVVRGEIFSISSIVYNYLSSPMMVKLYMEGSQDLQMSDCPKCNIPQCLLPQKTIAFTWDAKALRMGLFEACEKLKKRSDWLLWATAPLFLYTGSPKIQLKTEAIETQELCDGEKPIVPDIGASDSLVKTLNVKAEGVPVEMTHNSILCGGANLSSENISIKLPPGVVQGSAVANFSVVGDLMGSALEGIEQLLLLPRGCGEQNMVRFVPNIYLLDYLASANLLSEEVKKKGIGYILHGYQRQLKYRRDDGSFSTFGDNDEEGNTWLSASVMKAFCAASRYIYVDPKYKQDIAAWLRKNQLPNGSFKNMGKLFKASMQGDDEDEMTLTTYITVALLEAHIPMEDEMVQSALKCLRDSVPKVDSLYTKAMLAYVFTLSRDHELRDSLLHELHDKAVHTDGHTYWPANPNKRAKDNVWSRPNSNEVEMASYVLLAQLSMDNPTKTDINKASGTAQWVAKQQNVNGGFASTQDTVVGLQALSLFSELTYSKHGGLDVMFSPGGENTVHRYHVDENTRLLLQKKQLERLPGDYNVQVKGEGCVFLKTSLKYNMYPNKVSPFFKIKLNMTWGDKTEKSTPALYYTVSVWYTGPRSQTNMALLETELPSGFTANLESLEKLKTNKLVKRTETTDKRIILYIQELCKTKETFEFSAEQKFIVKGMKPCSIKVSDYYEPEEEGYIIYKAPKL